MYSLRNGGEYNVQIETELGVVLVSSSLPVPYSQFTTLRLCSEPLGKTQCLERVLHPVPTTTVIGYDRFLTPVRKRKT